MAAGALMIYLCWRIIAPFLPALCWALGLLLVVQPVYLWLLRKGLPQTLAALTLVSMIALAVVGPAAMLIGALAREAADVVNHITNEPGIGHLQETIERSRLVGPLFRWLDSHYDLPNEAMQLARSAAGWASKTISSLLAGSLLGLTQVAVTLFVLFYFLRDGELFARKLSLLLPVPRTVAEILFQRVARTIRVALGGKMVIGAIQGSLGGVIFGWLGIPAPVFWGSVMAALSLLPVVGSSVIWVPAALILALDGDWQHALLLLGWGVLIIHPVDNLLGPILVGKALHLHTLLIFFSIIGGVAAFGPTGLVLGPVIVTVSVALVEMAESSVTALPPNKT